MFINIFNIYSKRHNCSLKPQIVLHSMSVIIFIVDDWLQHKRLLPPSESLGDKEENRQHWTYLTMSSFLSEANRNTPCFSWQNLKALKYTRKGKN